MSKKIKILNAASELLAEKGQTTTLEIKHFCRDKYKGERFKQREVSEVMSNSPYPRKSTGRFNVYEPLSNHKVVEYITLTEMANTLINMGSEEFKVKWNKTKGGESYYEGVLYDGDDVFSPLGFVKFSSNNDGFKQIDTRGLISLETCNILYLLK